MIFIKKLDLCIIFGGKSSEHEVSLRSAYTVLKEADRDIFNVKAIYVARSGKWYHFTGGYEEILKGNIESYLNAPVLINLDKGCFVLGKEDYLPNVVFPVMHGDFCEDGRLQALLDITGIKYVGPTFFSSFLCYNKHLTKEIARGQGVPVARDILVMKNQLNDLGKIKESVKKIGYPVFVKPSSAGSSVGASPVYSEGELESALSLATDTSPFALIEEYIKGKECEVGVISLNGELVLSPVGSIIYEGGFYDYDTKYLSNNVKYEIPAKIIREQESSIRKYAGAMFLALGCCGLSRIDFFVTENRVVFNEINTLPGFTEGSMFPMLFNQMGISTRELITLLCNI